MGQCPGEGAQLDGLGEGRDRRAVDAWPGGAARRWSTSSPPLVAASGCGVVQWVATAPEAAGEVGRGGGGGGQRVL